MSGGRTRAIDSAGVRERAERAREFLRVAETLAAASTSAGRAVALSNAVEAGIAAADAICGRRLGECSTSERHDDAAVLLGRALASSGQQPTGLSRLLSVKSRAQYGSAEIGAGLLTENLRRAEALVALMEQVLREG